jgi:predicted membrane chloride channel (bestrophin family)
MRVPIRVAYLLRKTTCSQSKRLRIPIHVVQENKLLASIDNFMGGYYGIRKFLTTPVPFPLVQMARTLLFLYVFTVPFVMLSDKSNYFAHCFSVFLLTYGFMGLEVVAIQLDNPFGDDPNDFDNAYVCLVCVPVDGSSFRLNLTSSHASLTVPWPTWLTKIST